jgi:addiction module HigA family antidote
MARTAVHPGEHLAEQLKALGMSAAELGRQLKVPTNRNTGIPNAQRVVTGGSVLRLAHFFGNSPEIATEHRAVVLAHAPRDGGRAILEQ